ncbi:hypothetical protein FZEAL_4403 [Fusarium zealandicum]|uniref:TRP C-terminal domain-containing protein n=1 Tax=Fusarium zealandicum TaxID=1053134 RepID=A0A8H4ULX5_9HYPO|nr:hypothetical protein FZEAL_4403 [Fusarium zealandicum]
MLSFGTIFFLLLLALVRPGLPAYIQRRDCISASAEALSSHPQFKPDSLAAFLDETHNETRLQLRITGQYPELKSCEQSRSQNVSVGLKLAALGGTGRYHGEILNSTCESWTMPGQDNALHAQAINFLFRIDKPAPLAAFELEVDMRGSDNLPVGCLEGFLTPDIGTTMQGISLWGPAMILALSMIAAGWREWFNLALAVTDEEQDSDSRHPSRSHLTRIADCLSYIQFIFFAGGLSLQYPGFLQPVVSSASWSTLMLQRGIVVRGSHYYGIHDGIHEINGTFGGTTGLEHMKQVMGAPITIYAWANIVTLALVILVCLFIIIQLGLNLRWTRDWFQKAGRWTLESSSQSRHKATFWFVLRVFLSYFLLPLTAWTAYQLDNARWLPIYHIILTAFVVFLLLAACWWGLSSQSPKNMGYLLVDDLNKQVDDQEPSRAQDYYTVATFAFLLIRGGAIGGLQHFETEQLLVLIACEVAQLGLATWAWSISGLFSRTTMVTCARLLVLLFCLGMVRDITSHQVASALGYAVLVFHALFLIGVFLVPSLYELVRLAMAGYKSRETASNQSQREEQPQQRPQAYNLRQLARRPTTITNLSIRGMVDHERANSLSSQGPSFSSPRASSLGLKPVSPETLRTYVRSPRPERSSMNLVERSQHFEPLGRSTPDSESESSVRSDSQSSGRQSDSRLETGEASQAWHMATPSNPNVDYSFREADLYYVRPRRVSFRQKTPVDSEDSGRKNEIAAHGESPDVVPQDIEALAV